MSNNKSIKQGPQKLVFHKIHFTLRRKVKFGEAVYVCGSTPQLGLWNPERGFRLKWNEGDNWTGTLLITSKIPSQIQYKYVVASWENPSSQRCQWEVGSHNRKADLNQTRPLTFIDDRWNIDLINIYLITKRSNSPQHERYYITGSIHELGAWKQRKLLKKNLNSSIKNHLNQMQNENLTRYSNKQYQIWTYSFEIFRLQTQFYYYYMRRGDITQNQRKPGRIFRFDNQQAQYPCRKTVIHPRGYIVIIDESSIDQLKLSKITSSIFVGNYVKTLADVEKLKNKNVTTILSIQSEKDYKKNGVSPYYLQALCLENGLKFKRVSIEDMNKKDFISRAEEGVRIIDETIKQNGKIYVHCTAGIYRSPQMIALYLAAFKKYKIEEAVALLKEKHSYAQPNFRTIQQALDILKKRENREVLRG